MSAYAITGFVFGVLLLTHPKAWRWAADIYHDLQDFLRATDTED